MYREHNPSILNSFLDYLRILGYSKYTIKGYNLDLLQFFNKRLSGITHKNERIPYFYTVTYKRI